MSNFNPMAAYHYAGRLCKPRLVKTSGELEARQTLSEALRLQNLPAEETWFKFYPGFPFAFLKLSLALLLFFLLVQTILLRNHFVGAALFGLAIPAAALLLKRAWEYFERNMHIDFSRRYALMQKISPNSAQQVQTANIETSLPAGDNARTVVYLTAHYDSKSQNISITLRILCTLFVYIGLFLTPILYLIALILPGLREAVPFRVLTYALFVATIVAGYFLILLTVENKSPGAVDNAASCGFLLALSQMWSESQTPPFENLEIRMVFTGGEEVGLAGASELVRRNRDRWAKERAQGKRHYFLNFDGIGMSKKHTMTAATALLPQKDHPSASLLGHVRNAAQKLGLPIKHLKGILGGEADHMPLVQAGQPAVSIGSISNAVLAIHTEQDTLDKVDPKAIAATAELTLEILSSLDREAKE